MDDRKKLLLDIENLNQSLQEKQRIINELNSIIESYKNSTSWKLTAPIRKVTGAFKKKTPVDKTDSSKYEEVNIPEPMIDPEPMQNEDVTDLISSGNEEILKEYVEYVMNIPFQGEGLESYTKKDESGIQLNEDDVKYIAFYLPQFHSFPENDEWWGKGFTEWTNVTKTMPQFTGHYQPRLAGELGYYDLKMPGKIEEQIAFAKLYGVYGFCIYYYWFDGKKLMETPLQYLFQHKEIDFPFCICWANENWSRRWDGKESDILIAQNYETDFANQIMKDIEKYLMDERYIRVNGKPLFVIYNANQIPKLSEVLETWRTYCRQSGIGEIYIAAVDFALTEDSKSAGFDTFIEFPPHSVYFYDKTLLNDSVNIIDPEYQGTIYDYQEIVENKEYLKSADENLIPGVFLAWDNTARKKNASTVYHNYSPEAFQKWLTDLTYLVKSRQKKGNRFLFINAWNEWAEGTYLEPDRKYGFGALDAVKKTILDTRENKKKIIYVSHDTCFNGAQMLALNTIRIMKDIFGYKVITIVKEKGELYPEFEETSSIIVDYRDFENDIHFQNWVRSTGSKIALCNTVISGDVLKQLTEAGIKCISTIHEMENVIKQYHAENYLAQIFESADSVIFPSQYVIDSVKHVMPVPTLKTKVMHQGMFFVNPYLKEREIISKNIRNQYGIKEDDTIILGVGYGYKRKGTDLFLQAAKQLCHKYDNVVFLWVGELETEMEKYIADEMQDFADKDRILFVGNQKDLMRYYCAADVFLLTSREDPFPSVVMEAMYASLPVIAFAGGGGYVEIIQEKNGGMLVPMEDLQALIQEIEILIINKNTRLERGLLAHNYAVEEFEFKKYVQSLLEMLGETITKVSVVVPNYNYGRYLRERLDSILEQDYPIYEILLLDDCSTDSSKSIIQAYQNKYPHLIKAYFNNQNSGSVFRQWKKGFLNAKGDYIWIAEADDLCEPNMLSSLMKYMEEDSEICLGYVQSKMMDEDGNIIGDNYFCWTEDISTKDWNDNYIIRSKEEIERHLSVKNTIPNVSAVVFRNNKDIPDLLEKSIQYKVAGDWIFYLNLLSNGGKTLFIAKNYNMHRRHTGSVTDGLKLERHFKEICEAQDLAAEISGVKNKKAVIYREKVRSDFGLDREE